MKKKNTLATTNSNSNTTALANNEKLKSTVSFVAQFVNADDVTETVTKKDSNGNTHEITTITTDSGKYAITSPALATAINELAFMDALKEGTTLGFYVKLAVIDKYQPDYKKTFAVENIGELAKVLYSKKKDTVNLYVRAVNMFYDFDESGNVTPKIDYLENASISNLALSLGIVNAKCGGDVKKFEEMYLDTGDLHLNAKQGVFKAEKKRIDKVIDDTPENGENSPTTAPDATPHTDTPTTEESTIEEELTPEKQLEENKLNAISQLGYVATICEQIAPEKVERINTIVSELMEILA